MSKETRAKAYVQMIRENEKKPCSHPGCTRLRRHLNKSCPTHYIRYVRWGSTDGRLLTPGRDYPKEMDLVRHLLSINQGLCAWQLGIDWVHEVTEAAAKGRRDFADLTPYLVNAHRAMETIDVSEKILSPMVALLLVEKGLFQQIEGMGVRWRDHLIGHALIRYPHNRLVKGLKPRCEALKERKLAARLVWDSIGQLLLTMAQACDVLQKKLDEKFRCFAGIKVNTDPKPKADEPETAIYTA